MYRQLEQELSQHADDAHLNRKAEEHELLQLGSCNHVNHVCYSLANCHASNVLCVKLWPGEDNVITGSGKQYSATRIFAGTGIRIVDKSATLPADNLWLPLDLW